MSNPSHLQVSPAAQKGSSAKRHSRSHGRATLADVAAQAGVTTMTVSRYLRDASKVAASTAHNIQAALETTGYTPNLQAGSLASGRSKVVAVIVPNMAHSIFADTLHGLGAGLQAAGLHMLVSSTGYSTAQEEEQLRTLLGWAPAGIVVTGRRHSSAALSLMRQAQQRGTPVIEMWDKANEREKREFMQIGFSHTQAGQQMAQALLHAAGGARELVYIDSGVAEDFRAHERAQAFVAQCVAAGRRVQLLTASSQDYVSAGRELIQQWCKRLHKKPTAMAFANDLLACGALFAAQQAKLRVPQDLSLLGFGDFALGRHVNVAAGRQGLSTLHINGEQIGQLCAQYLTAPEDSRGLDIQVLPELMQRNT